MKPKAVVNHDEIYNVFVYTRSIWVYEYTKTIYTNIYIYICICTLCINYGCDVEIGHSGNYKNYMTNMYDTEKSARNL